jgi:gamma-glutamylcyclotransferase (GGCT)/AIG2-like uncharacterized protein YtfP
MTTNARATGAASRRSEARRASTARAREHEATRLTVFAYGSNLDEQQMRQRCPDAVVLGRARLPNHALVFGGFSARWDGPVASLGRLAGAELHGLLYGLTQADLTRLDACEGVPFAYGRVTKMVVDERGRRRRAQVYLLAGEVEMGEPGRRYYGVIRSAYARLGFDDALLRRAAEGWR